MKATFAAVPVFDVILVVALALATQTFDVVLTIVVSTEFVGVHFLVIYPIGSSSSEPIHASSATIASSWV